MDVSFKKSDFMNLTSANPSSLFDQSSELRPFCHAITGLTAVQAGYTAIPSRTVGQEQ